MQNVNGASIGLDGGRALPGIVRRVPTGTNLNINGGHHVCPLDGSGNGCAPLRIKPAPSTSAPTPSGPSALDPCTEFGGPNCISGAKPGSPGYIPPSVGGKPYCGEINGNPYYASDCSNIGGTSPVPSTTPPTSTPTPGSDCSDPITCAFLGGFGGGGSGTLPAGLGATPSGFIGSGQTASGGSSAAVIIVVVILAVVGYFLWEKYKGKLKKHEEASA